MTNNTGDTALHTVCSALVAGTLVAGVSAAARCHLISYKNGIGETALDTATRAGRSAVEKYLLGIQEKSDHKQITVVSCGGLCVEQDDSVHDFTREGLLMYMFLLRNNDKSCKYPSDKISFVKTGKQLTPLLGQNENVL